MTITYTVHDRAGKKGHDVTITVRSDGSPDEVAVYQRMYQHTNGFTAVLPCYVAGSGITVQSVARQARQEAANS